VRNKIYPVLLVIFTMLITSIATSQAKTSETTYHACVAKSSGAIKIVKANKKCKKSENKISWTNNAQAGTDALDPIYLTAKDLENSAAGLATFGTHIIGGFDQPAWEMVGDDDKVPFIFTNIPKPSGWENVTEVKISFYWVASESDGEVLVNLCMAQFEVGSALSGCGWGDGTYFGVPEANELNVLSGFYNISDDDSLIHLGFERYNYIGGSSIGDDTNSGNVYVLGAKIEPITESAPFTE
jgi:hypothetical protein